MLIPDVQVMPVEYIKYLCTLSHVLVIASGELKTPIHGFFYLVRLAPSLNKQKQDIVNYASKMGLTIPNLELALKAQSFSVFLAICDGYGVPLIKLKYAEVTAYTLLTTGATTSENCKLILYHAWQGCSSDKAKHRVLQLVSECDLQMTICKRNIILCKILQDYMTQIAKYSSSE